MSRTVRSTALWAAVVPLVGVSAMGLYGGLEQVEAAGLGGGLASAAFAGVVIWLATRRRTPNPLLQATDAGDAGRRRPVPAATMKRRVSPVVRRTSMSFALNTSWWVVKAGVLKIVQQTVELAATPSDLYAMYLDAPAHAASSSREGSA